MSDAYFRRSAECRRSMRRDGLYAVPGTTVANLTKQMLDAGYCIDAPEHMPTGSAKRGDRGETYGSFTWRWLKGV